MVAASDATVESEEMKTPPDFESPSINGLPHSASAEFRRVYAKLETIEHENNKRWEIISKRFAEATSDRRWYKWAVGIAVVGLLGQSFVLYGWSNRLSAVEIRQQAHIERGMEMGNSLRRDLDRNTMDIEKLQQNEWRPRDAKKEK